MAVYDPFSLDELWENLLKESTIPLWTFSPTFAFYWMMAVTVPNFSSISESFPFTSSSTSGSPSMSSQNVGWGHFFATIEGILLQLSLNGGRQCLLDKEGGKKVSLTYSIGGSYVIFLCGFSNLIPF